MKLWTVRSSYLLCTLCAIKEVEYDTRTGPPQLDSFEYTGNMEYVAASDLHTGTLIVALRVTNRAIVISRLSICELFIFLHTLWIETGQTLSFILEATAGVTTRKHFIAIFIH
jgi:hypothetical protein